MIYANILVPDGELSRVVMEISKMLEYGEFVVLRLAGDESLTLYRPKAEGIPNLGSDGPAQLMIAEML